MTLAPYMSPPRCDGVLTDEALLGCLHHRPGTALGAARFLRQPIGEVLKRLQDLRDRGLVGRNEAGLYYLLPRKDDEKTEDHTE